MRWLLLKDLRILRRSPVLAGTLIVYPIAIALMIGFALSSPPAKPAVAIYSGIKPGTGTVAVGGQRIDVAGYVHRLFASIRPIHAASPAAAVAAVRDGRALAALIVPADLTSQIASLVRNGIGSPTVDVVLNDRNPIDRTYVQESIQSRLDTVEQAVSRQVLQVAVRDLRQVLNGGSVNLLGRSIPLLGLRDTRTIVRGAIGSLPRDDKLVPALQRVVRFASLAIEGLAFAGPVLDQIGTPLAVQETHLAGRTTPTAAYAVAIAATVSVMFVALLLAAGMLALERSEHAYGRLVRGLVAPEALLGEKVVLGALCGAVVALAMAAVVSAFIPLDWGRVELWVLALLAAGLAFAALGVALGGLARDVSAASLLALLLSLPIAFVALVPSTAASGSVGTVLDVISFVFPFRAGLEAVSNAFSATAPAIGLPLLHLLGLAVAAALLARSALGRFAAPV